MYRPPGTSEFSHMSCLSFFLFFFFWSSPKYFGPFFRRYFGLYLLVHYRSGEDFLGDAIKTLRQYISWASHLILFLQEEIFNCLKQLMKILQYPGGRSTSTHDLGPSIIGPAAQKNTCEDICYFKGLEDLSTHYIISSMNERELGISFSPFRWEEDDY